MNRLSMDSKTAYAWINPMRPYTYMLHNCKNTVRNTNSQKARFGLFRYVLTVPPPSTEGLVEGDSISKASGACLGEVE